MKKIDLWLDSPIDLEGDSGRSLYANVIHIDTTSGTDAYVEDVDGEILYLNEMDSDMMKNVEQLIYDAFMRPFQISYPEDVARLFYYLVFVLHVDLHPDDDFSDYKNADGTPSFTAEEVSHYNALMKDAFRVCEDYDRDIYQLGLYILAAHNYANGLPVAM